MGMIVEKAAMGLQTEDPAAQAIADLQELRKISLQGLPCAAQQQFAEFAVASQVATQLIKPTKR